MKLVGVKTIYDYQKKHADVVSQTDSWIQEVKSAMWNNPHDIKKRYSSADFLGNNYVVINIKGNSYRLLFRVNFELGIVVVKKLGHTLNMTNGNSNKVHMRIKVIKNHQEYQEALELIDVLMDTNPKPNTPNAEKLELITTLVQAYEDNVFTENLPDPVDALIFRMEQQDLTPKDLVPYIGSRSKVSEVLSRKRTLSLNMIKSLQNGLDIPAKVLLNQRVKSSLENFDYDKFPIKEMKNGGGGFKE